MLNVFTNDENNVKNKRQILQEKFDQILFMGINNILIFFTGTQIASVYLVSQESGVVYRTINSITDLFSILRGVEKLCQVSFAKKKETKKVMSFCIRYL